MLGQISGVNPQNWDKAKR